MKFEVGKTYQRLTSKVLYNCIAVHEDAAWMQRREVLNFPMYSYDQKESIYFKEYKEPRKREVTLFLIESLSKHSPCIFASTERSNDGIYYRTIGSKKIELTEDEYV